jgi:hypothetical protein
MAAAFYAGVRRLSMRLVTCRIVHVRAPQQRCHRVLCLRSSSGRAHSTSHASTAAAPVGWAGCALGCTLVAAGVGTLSGVYRAHAKEEINPCDPAVAAPMMKAICTVCTRIHEHENLERCLTVGNQFVSDDWRPIFRRRVPVSQTNRMKSTTRGWRQPLIPSDSAKARRMIMCSSLAKSFSWF